MRLLIAFIATALFAPLIWGQPLLTMQLVKKHPHQPSLFTQGLAIVDQTLFESSGLYGKSFVEARRLSGGETLASYYLPRKLFAEGLTVVDDEVFVLTWREGTALVLDRKSLALQRRAHYKGEGWGLTWNGEHLLMSNGSAIISFRNTTDFTEHKRIEVHDNEGNIYGKLNELEWVDGWLLANVWQQAHILLIDPATGLVHGRLELGHLTPPKPRFGRSGVANGIAYDQKTGHLWLTGKGWPILYEVKVSLPSLAKRSGDR